MLLRAREARLQRANAWRFAAGLGTLIGVAGVSFALLAGWVATKPEDPSHPRAHRTPAQFAKVVFPVEAVLAAGLVPVEIRTRKRSHVDVARHVLACGCRGGGVGGDPVLRVTLAVLAAGLLWGEFLILDAILAGRMAARLHAVDRHRAALVLAMVRTDPTGIDPRLLLRAGEHPSHLRELLAYLVATGWVDINGDGDRLTLLPPGSLPA